MSDTYDVAVAGLGAIGSAAAAELSGRGLRVLGLDRYRPPHALGSSHGGSRMLREAYYRGTPYVPFLETARAGWTALEERSGLALVRPADSLMIGPPGGTVFGGCATAKQVTKSGPRAAPERLSAPDLARRFPAFRTRPTEVGVLEPDAAVLALEPGLEAYLAIATESGAELRFDEPLEAWSVEGGFVRLRTDSGTCRARRLVLAAGAWSGPLLADLDLPLAPERTVCFWFEPRTDADPVALSEPACPLWVWEHDPRSEWYGFPLADGTLKVGIHIRAGRETDPDGVRRTIDAAEVGEMRGILERYLPAAAGACLDASVCLYTNTPDRHFVLDRHPRHREVVLFAGGSGHAFKFAPAIGRILADLATGADPGHDLTPFRATRF